MANQYRALKIRQQKEFNKFSVVYAFNEAQFIEGLRKLGLDISEKDQVCALQDTGGFIRKSDKAALAELFDRHHREIAEAIAADKTGNGFIYDMFRYELAAHEYGFTEDPSEALEALGLTFEDVENDPRMLRALQRAMNSLS